MKGGVLFNAFLLINRGAAIAASRTTKVTFGDNIPAAPVVDPLIQKYLLPRRLTATKDTAQHPRVVEHQNLTLVRCRNYASAYSAAWLAPREYVIRCPYGNRLTLEWHSHNLYNSVKGASYKFEDKHAFYVNHMSYYEHAVAGNSHSPTLSPGSIKSILSMSKAEEHRACSLFRQNLRRDSGGSATIIDTESNLETQRRLETTANPTSLEHPRGKYYQSIVGLVPFYPGKTGNDSQTGNAHSVSPPEIKAIWLKATVCSMLAYMGHVLVGVCHEEHYAMAKEQLAGADFRHSVHVRLLDCEKPVYLPYVLLRTVQQQLGKPIPSQKKPTASNLKKGTATWNQTRYIYFSEMDNVLHVRDTATMDAAVSFVGKKGYVSPNRMNKRSKMDAGDISDKAFIVNGQNKCARD